jgi:hypothetical protein
MMCVKLTLPPRLRARWLLMTIRLSMSSLAGTARTDVAVGTASEASMFVTTRALAPRIGRFSPSLWAACVLGLSMSRGIGADGLDGVPGSFVGLGVGVVTGAALACGVGPSFVTGAAAGAAGAGLAADVAGCPAGAGSAGAAGAALGAAPLPCAEVAAAGVWLLLTA